MKDRTLVMGEGGENFSQSRKNYNFTPKNVGPPKKSFSKK